MRTKLFITFLSILVTASLFAQTTEKPFELYLDFPAMDLNYQSYATRTTGSFLTSYANPSMKQSMAISNNLYSSVHYGFKKIFKTKYKFISTILTTASIGAFDFISTYTPLGHAWLHEEYHRAVMTRRGIDSFNDVNSFPFGETVIAVRKIKDAQLADLFENHNADYRRTMTAGLEGSFAQIRSLQSNNFYYGLKIPNTFLYWFSTYVGLTYINGSTTERFNDLVDDLNESDGADIDQRDFAGPDFSAWAYALVNPDVAYDERGVHPSGVGIDRYIRPSELSEEATLYLKTQAGMPMLNFISPHMFGFSRIKIKSSPTGNHYGNFAVRHVLTPFGNDIALDVYYQTPNTNYFFSVHNYNNKEKIFAGLEAGVIDKSLLMDKVLVSARSMVWLQPKKQSFTSTQGALGGLLAIKASYGMGIFYPYIELEGKTRGWVMSNVFLNENLSVLLGMSMRM